MIDSRVAEARAQFPSALTCTYLDHAAVGPISIAVAAALHSVTDAHVARGFQVGWRDEIETVRGQVARLVNGADDGVAFVQNTSFGISLAANGIDWRPGDNVVLPEREFPSNYYPWINLRDRGVEVRFVSAPAGHAATADISEAIDANTRAVAVSAVQYSNGFRYDLDAIGSVCRDRDVLFVVDGTQSVGALRIDVTRSAIDMLAVSAHKWMLGPHGIGFVHLSERALTRLRPDIVGWLSVAEPFAFDYRLDLAPTATRFEPGTENIAGIIGLGATIGLIEHFGPDWIEQRVLQLTDHICERVVDAGGHVVSPRTGDERSGIVIVNGASERGTDDDWHRRLTAAGVRCSMRGGGIRFSPHYYNTTDEIDAALEAAPLPGSRRG